MKMQNFGFKTVDDFLAYLPEDELKITKVLRELVLDCLPTCKEKLSYNVPFYSYHKAICFIWPASITWGNKITYQGVRLGFSYGYLLTNNSDYLEKGKRKQVYWRDIKTLNDIDVSIIRSLLFEAFLIDTNSSL